MSVFEDMSDAEEQVAATLTDLRIWWTYEQPVCVKDEKSRPRVWIFSLADSYLYLDYMMYEDSGREKNEKDQPLSRTKP